jgi:hypothetical protein
VDCFAARVSPAGVWQELIPLVMKTVELRKHSPQQQLSRGCVDSSPSQAQDVVRWRLTWVFIWLIWLRIPSIPMLVFPDLIR